jgi:hypothetical protein
MEQLMDLVLQCNTKEAAQALIDKEVKRISEESSVNVSEAKRRVIFSIGYMAGYCSNQEEAKQIFEMFETEHPFFGKTLPEPDVAFNLGCRLGELTASAEGMKKVLAFMDAGDYAGLRAWMKETQ